MTETRDRTSRKRFLFPLGLLTGLVILFSLFDLAGPPRREVDGSRTTREVSGPRRPTLSREGETTIVLDNGFVHTSRFRYDGVDGREKADALFECLEAGIEGEFGSEDAPIDPLEGVERRRRTRALLRLTDEIKAECLEELSSD